MIDESQLIRIAVIIGTHSLKGRFKIYLVSDSPDRFKINNYIYLKEEKGYSYRKITEFKHRKNRIYLLKLDGIDSISAAQDYKCSELFITKLYAEESRKYLEEDSYYYYDIIGCKVYLGKKEFGEVTEILEAGAGEILIISDKSGKKIMVPFVKSMVDTANISEKRIDIYPVEGLIDI